MSQEIVALETVEPMELYTGDTLTAIIEEIEAKAREFVPDTSTAGGRKAIASEAHKVARSKTFIDAAGKGLGAELREKLGAINEQRRMAADRLDALKAEVRQPLTEWEVAEAARAERSRRIIDAIGSLDVRLSTTPWTPRDIRGLMGQLESIEITEDMGDMEAEAHRKRDEVRAILAAAMETAETREREAAELERLRAAEAERHEAQRKAQEERARKEREEQAKREEAERLEREKAAREKAVQEAAERATREADERAEQARQEAARNVERQKAAAKLREETLKRQKAEADARAARAVEEERARVEREAEAERQAEQRRKHAAECRDMVRGEIAVCVQEEAELAYSAASCVAAAIVAGKIARVRVDW